MATPQDLHIWMTGVVGRAMGSGKFSAEDIDTLADHAQNTFNRIFGEVRVEVKRYDPPPQRSIPGAHPIGAVAQQIVSGGNDVPASDERGFAKWGSWGARCFVFGKNAQCPNFGKPWNEVTWEEFLQMATNEDAQALKALNRMANDELKGGQWEKQNRARIANAKCVLGMARKMKADAEASESMGGDGDSTPF